MEMDVKTKEIENIIKELKSEQYFISFIVYKKEKSDFGSCVLKTKSVAVFKNILEKDLAEKIKVDKVIITNYVKLADEEAKIFNLMG